MRLILTLITLNIIGVFSSEESIRGNKRRLANECVFKNQIDCTAKVDGVVIPCKQLNQATENCFFPVTFKYTYGNSAETGSDVTLIKLGQTIKIIDDFVDFDYSSTGKVLSPGEVGVDSSKSNYVIDRCRRHFSSFLKLEGTTADGRYCYSYNFEQYMKPICQATADVQCTIDGENCKYYIATPETCGMKTAVYTYKYCNNNPSDENGKLLFTSNTRVRLGGTFPSYDFSALDGGDCREYIEKVDFNSCLVGYPYGDLKIDGTATGDNYQNCFAYKISRGRRISSVCPECGKTDDNVPNDDDLYYDVECDVSVDVTCTINGANCKDYVATPQTCGTVKANYKYNYCNNNDVGFMEFDDKTRARLGQGDPTLDFNDIEANECRSISRTVEFNSCQSGYPFADLKIHGHASGDNYGTCYGYKIARGRRFSAVCPTCGGDDDGGYDDDLYYDDDFNTDPFPPTPPSPTPPSPPTPQSPTTPSPPSSGGKGGKGGKGIYTGKRRY